MTRISVAGVEVDTRHWIGGQRLASESTFDTVSPIDGRVIGQVSRGGRAEADAAVAAAKTAFPAWSRMSPEERGEILFRLADSIEAHVEELSQISDAYVCAYPNAGLPNAFGEYDETACETADLIRDYAASGFVNIVGGCCGTTPEHISHIAESVSGLPPRRATRRCW